MSPNLADGLALTIPTTRRALTLVAVRGVERDSEVMTNSTTSTDHPPTTALAVVSAEEAFAALGIHRDSGYRAMRAGRFPLPVIRIGRAIRIPRAALEELIERGNCAGYASGRTAMLELDFHDEQDSARPPAPQSTSGGARRATNGGRR